MKTQCPDCKKILSVPDIYKGKRIKCDGCKHTLTAVKYVVDIKNIEPTEEPWRGLFTIFLGKPIICPNLYCGYKGFPKKTARGSLLTGLFLCCFFLLPGIIYFAFKSGYRYSCPECGIQIRIDN